MNASTFSFLEEIALFFDGFEGQVTIEEKISLQNGNWDRHFTTTNSFQMNFRKFYFRISGAVIIFEGENSFYEIFISNIVKTKQQKHAITFQEQLSEKVVRLTTIRFL